MIYLDFQASTPLASEVALVMHAYLQDHFGNPHSADHAIGRKAAVQVDQARGQVAASIGASPSEILFTSGATEANNTALFGVMRMGDKGGKKGHLIVSATEHACVLSPADALAEQGYAVTVLPVDEQGMLDPVDVAKAIRPDTRLVSVMMVNNEIGVIQPLDAIAKICREAEIVLHSDAAQGLGRLRIRVKDIPVDLLSLSGHKAYGPKGIGALFIRRGLKLHPFMLGGGQEKHIRSGTLSPMLCAGFGTAAVLADESYEVDQHNAVGLLSILRTGLDNAGVNYRINGSLEHRVADNLNIHFPDCSTEDLLSRLDNIAVSSASACSSTKNAGSHVLRALGHDISQRGANIRLSVGRITSEADMRVATDSLIAAVTAK